MPSLLELPDLTETVVACQSLGLSFIELNLDVPTWCPEQLPAATLRKLAAERGVGFTMHLPEELDFASFHPAIREGHAKRAHELVAWAGEAGIEKVNMHLNSGIYFTLPHERVWLYDVHRQAFLAALAESMSALYVHARHCGVTVCVENAVNFDQPFIQEALAALADMDGFALTWDVGHDTKSGLAERPVIERYLANIRHMHLHDCSGSKDHQVLFTGDVDVGAAIQFAADRDVSVVVEVKTLAALRESVAALRRRALM